MFEIEPIDISAYMKTKRVSDLVMERLLLLIWEVRRRWIRQLITTHMIFSL